MRLRKPYTVATIWSSGKIWCTGASTLAKAKQGARRIARRLMHLGYECRFSNYRILNVMAKCRLPFRVSLESLSHVRPKQMSYEPELTPGLTFKPKQSSSTSLTLFSTGRVVVMGSTLENIKNVVEELVPLAMIHQTDETPSDSSDDECLTACLGDKNSQRRQYYRRRRGRARRMNPFTELAAQEFPALADVFLEENVEEEVEEDIYSDDEDTADVSSAEPIFANNFVEEKPLPPSPSLDNVRSGAKKCARVVTYSQQQQEAVVATSSAPITAVQTPQFIYAAAAPTSTQVVRYVTAPVNGSGTTTLQPQIATFAPTQTKVVTVNATNVQPTSILRVVSPLQMGSPNQQQQPQQRIIINRVPAGAFISPNTTFVMAGGNQLATQIVNGQTQIFRAIAPSNTVTVTAAHNPIQQTNLTPTSGSFITPEYH
ncbi:hypothetical protein Aperf_G00000115398 [Anoplocephala perfoliata]